jgi:cytochrome o ubiquinol oxidase subunit 1
MGATRRLDHYAAATGYQPYFITAGIGVCIISIGVVMQVWQVIVSVRERRNNMDTTGDPWDGHTLEWATSSPMPFYNFVKIPEVNGRDAFWEMKKQGMVPGRAMPEHYEDIELSKNTGMAIYLSAFFFLFSFGAVWHIIWLMVSGVAGAVGCVIARSFNEDTEYVLPAGEVERLEKLSLKNRHG